MLARKLQEDYYYEETPQIKTVPCHKRSLKPVSRVDNKLRANVMFLVVIASIFAMLITARSSFIASRSYEVTKTNQAAIELEASNAQMRIDNAKLKAPMRIKELAASSMGMSVPEQVYFAQEQVD